MRDAVQVYYRHVLRIPHPRRGSFLNRNTEVTEQAVLDSKWPSLPVAGDVRAVNREHCGLTTG